jgi:hypothetical protein
MFCGCPLPCRTNGRQINHRGVFKRGFRYWLSIFADVLLSIKVNERSFFIELHRAEKIKRIILSRKAFPIQGMPWEHLISEIR